MLTVEFCRNFIEKALCGVMHKKRRKTLSKHVEKKPEGSSRCSKDLQEIAAYSKGKEESQLLVDWSGCCQSKELFTGLSIKLCK